MKNDMKKRVARGALNQIAAVAALTAALAAAPSAWALGLGRLSVQSALGESLRAEIDVSSLSPEEASNLRVRVAPPEFYRGAGIDYNAILPATAVTLQRRADGTPFLRVVSDRSVQEPFVDLILELTWPSGRLVREYTLLFDPPSSKAPAVASAAPIIAPAPVTAPAPTPAPVALAVAAAPAPAPAPVAEAPAAAPVASVPEKASSAAARSAPAARAAEPAKPTVKVAPAPEGDAASDYKVKAGDTLSKIAAKTQASGVSLDQMLVSLYRNNSQAFVGNNMNRLRSGVVLNVPTADQAGAVDKAEARKVILAQSADFNAYRQRLAGAVPEAGEKEPTRQAAGKVQTEVQDRKQAAAPSPDRLTLDKAKPGAASAPAIEDKVAKERAQKEAAARVQELSRNLEDLKKLQAASASAAATGASAAALGAVAGKTAAAAPTPSPAPVAPPVASAPPPPVVASAPVAEVASAPVVAASEAASQAPVAAASAASEVAAASAPLPASAPPVAEPVAAEPSLLDSLTENPLVLPGAGVILALLAGLGWYRLRSKNKDDAGVTSFLESRLQPDSFFGASGGQRVDTRDAAGTPSSMSYSLSQIDAIGDVDPVAEADVYLAYGRDLQAEEILKEAMRANPERLAIRTKLLEVYAKRRDTKGFELLAGELYGLTGGVGEDWTKAQELGRSIDPENPLYEPGGVPTTGSAALDSAMEPLGASTMPQSVVPSPSRFPDSAEIDLDTPPPSGSSAEVDLDISLPGPMDDAPLENSFRLSEPSAFGSSQVASAPAALETDSRSLEFNLDDLPPVESAPSSAARQDVDLGGLSLDLDTPHTGTGAHTASADLASAPLDLPLEDDGADPLSRKLELAEEFRQIGDLEGARDLLMEVLEKAEGDLKARAQGMLDNLS